MAIYEAAAGLLDLPVYSYGPFSLLGPLERFLGAGYAYYGAVVPRVSMLPVPALGQIEDRVVIPGGSYLLALSGASQQPEGFQFAIFDVGAARSALADRFDDLRTGARSAADEDPLGHVLAEPYVIVPPGVLQVSFVNLASVPNDAQLLLHFAIPIEAGLPGVGGPQ